MEGMLLELEATYLLSLDCQDWFSTCVKPLNIFQDTLGQILALFVVTKTFILNLNMMFS